MIELGCGLRLRYALSVLAGAAAIGSSLALLATSGYLISAAALRPPVLELAVAIVAVRAFGISRGAFRYLERLGSHDVALRFLARLRVRLFRGLMPLSPARLGTHHSGDLLARLVADLESLQDLLLRIATPPLVAAATLLLALAITAPLLPAAAAALGVTFLLAGAALPALGARLGSGAGERLIAARSRLHVELVELIHGAAELTAFGAQNAAQARVHKAQQEISVLARQQALREATAAAGGTMLAGLAIWLMLVIGVPAVRAGELQGVDLAVLALIAMALFEAATPIAALTRLGENRSALRRLRQLEAIPAPVVDPSHPLRLPSRPHPQSAGLMVENLWFRHGPDRPWALTGVDLCLRHGQVVAVTGPSGSGKTTLANILLRFLEPQRGEIRLHGLPLTKLAQDEVRRVIGLAAQDAHLFNTSILENVRLARPSATRPELEAAAEQAGLLDWIGELPEGWETRVGELGAQVSVGQRQRIALARAHLADFPILIADEPTAHLDPELADEITRRLLAYGRRRSLLLITHRPQDLPQADTVIRLGG